MKNSLIFFNTEEGVKVKLVKLSGKQKHFIGRFNFKSINEIVGKELEEEKLVCFYAMDILFGYSSGIEKLPGYDVSGSFAKEDYKFGYSEFKEESKNMILELSKCETEDVNPDDVTGLQIDCIFHFSWED